MDFSNTLPELADLNEQLPYPNTIAEAYWLAELACMCHRRLNGETCPAGFWGLLDSDDAKRLNLFLRDAGNGVSELANDLQMLAEPEPVPFGESGECDDIAADAIRCIDARLQLLGRKLDSASSSSLQLDLQELLEEAEFEFIDGVESIDDEEEPPSMLVG